MSSIAIVDTGPLVAAANRADPDHEACLVVLRKAEYHFPLGGTDASVIALAERFDTEIVITLDRRHFGAVRPRHCEGFRLLP